MPPTAQFTLTSPPPAPGITFEIDGEQFTCVPVLPGVAYVDVAKSTDSDIPEQITAAMRLLDLALEDESLTRFVARFRSKGGFEDVPRVDEAGLPVVDEATQVQIVDRVARPKPISFETTLELFQKLLGVFGSGNPTGGSSVSPSGSPAIGPPSTGIAPSGTSIP